MMGASEVSRHGWTQRGTALILSWVFLATSVWASAPPRAMASGPAPQVVASGRRAFAPGAPAGGSQQAKGSVADLAALERTLARYPFPGRWIAGEHHRPHPGTLLPDCAIGLFGPQTYARTTGAKDVFEATIDVPSWVTPTRAVGTEQPESPTVTVNS